MKTTTLTDLRQLKTVVTPTKYRSRYVRDENEHTDEQIIAYRRLRYGIRAYSESELSIMTPREHKAIIYAQERANEVINEIAQDKLNSFVIKTLKRVFPDLCGEAASLLMEPVFVRTFVVDNSITPLKVSQTEIITEFKRKGLL